MTMSVERSCGSCGGCGSRRYVSTCKSFQHHTQRCIDASWLFMVCSVDLGYIQGLIRFRP